MERQKRKLKGIADLYNIEDERHRRQQTHEEDVPNQNIFSQNISSQNTSQEEIAPQDVPQENISPETTSKKQAISSKTASSHVIPSPLSAPLPEDVPNQNISNQNIFTQNTSSEANWSSDLVDSARGYFPVFNDFTDKLIRELKLDVYEQAVLLKMYRESRGWKSEECEMSHAEIVRACNISKSQSQRTLAKLTARGLVVNLGRAKSGPERNRFRVLPGVPVIPPRNIFSQDISQEGQDVFSQNTVFPQDISCGNTNKHNNKELLNTHTQAGVGVGSKFSLEACRQYAEHLQKTGQGISNPGGYATSIFRSGEADAQIEAFLNAPAVPKQADARDCPTCHGAGYWYPDGPSKGVAKCKHEGLGKPSAENAE